MKNMDMIYVGHDTFPFLLGQARRRYSTFGAGRLYASLGLVYIAYITIVRCCLR